VGKAIVSELRPKPLSSCHNFIHMYSRQVCIPSVTRDSGDGSASPQASCHDLSLVFYSLSSLQYTVIYIYIVSPGHDPVPAWNSANLGTQSCHLSRVLWTEYIHISPSHQIVTEDSREVRCGPKYQVRRSCM